jgi:hypothetical protein
MLNVKYYIYPKDVESRIDYIHDQFKERADLILRYADDKVSIYENPKVYKRAFIVHSLIKSSDPDKVLKLIFDDAFDPASEAVVETDNDLSGYSSRLETGSDAHGSSVEITRYLPNSVDISVNAVGAGMLVLADNYDEGWKVLVDGREEKLYRANYIMRGVCVSKGVHTVRFTYDPWYFKVGAGITLCAGLLFIIYLIKSIRQ